MSIATDETERAWEAANAKEYAIVNGYVTCDTCMRVEAGRIVATNEGHFIVNGATGRSLGCSASGTYR